MSNFPSLATTLLLSILLNTTAFAADGELPQREPGKWKLQTEMDEGRGPIKQTLTMCITAEMEKSTAEAAAADHKSNCSRYDVKKVGETTIVDSECAYAVDKVTSRTEISGDFKKSFDVKIATTTITTPPSGKPLQRERKIIQTGENLGADCGDIKPGEAVTEDGNRVMVQ
jgi:hypothetical protein